MIITFDGPSCSGKSTLARSVAKELSFYYLNSGFLFRALAYLLQQYEGLTTESAIVISKQLLDSYLDPKRFRYTYTKKSGEQVWFDARNITPFLKDSTISQLASIISTHDIVRKALLLLQQAIAKDHSIVTDGRDVGSIVFPHAQIKFYVTAALDVRAQRCKKDQEAKGMRISLESAQEELKKRDERDMSRAYAPLTIPLDAIVIDTSDKTPQQTLKKVLSIIKQKRTEGV